MGVNELSNPLSLSPSHMHAHVMCVTEGAVCVEGHEQIGSTPRLPREQRSDKLLTPL